MTYNLRKYMKKYSPALILITFFLTLFLTIRECTINKGFILNAFLFSLLITITAAGILFFLSRKKVFLPVNRFLEKLLYRNFSDRTLFFILWAVITAFWVPAYLALFPGVFGYDVPVQMQQYFGYMELTSANPLLHTFIVGSFLSAGKSLFGSCQAGFSVFIAIQALLVTSCAARSFLFLKRKGAPVITLLIGLLWLLFNPALQVLSMNATKDILFGVFFLHFAMCFLDTLEKQETTRKTFAGLFVSGLAMCLFRNGSDYLVLVVLLSCLLARIKKKKLFLCLALIWGIFRLYSVICSLVFHIPGGDSREFLSVPIQQLAYVNFTDSMTDTQADVINEIMPEDEYSFMMECADFPKAAFRTDVFLENPKRYIRMYLEIGLENYAGYWAAFCHLTAPYFDMRQSENRSLSIEWTFPQLNMWDLEKNSQWEAYAVSMDEIIGDDDSFYIGMLSIGVYLLSILFSIAVARKDKITLLGLLPLVIYFIALLFCPVALMRYLYPIMLGTPLLFGLLFTDFSWHKSIMYSTSFSGIPHNPDM